MTPQTVLASVVVASAFRQKLPYLDAPRREHGAALIAMLMVITLLGALSAAVVLVTTAESRAAANHSAAQVALYAADAALEQTISELRGADWRTLPGGAVSARLWDGRAAPRAPDGTVLDLAQLTAARQAESDAPYGALANRPLWRLFAHAPCADLAPAGVVMPPVYLLVWMADDGDESDDDPERDSNDVVLVRAEALAASGARRSIEATLSRETGPAPGSTEPAGGASPALRQEVRILSWREVR